MSRIWFFQSLLVLFGVFFFISCLARTEINIFRQKQSIICILACNFSASEHSRSRCRSRWENLDRGQYPFRPIKFVNLLVPSPCETEPYNKALYGQLPEQARWIKSCAVIGYLNGQNGLSAAFRKEKFSLKPYSKCFIDQSCLVKMTGYCPRSFFACLRTSTLSRSTLSRSINTHKKNLPNIQPSWTHT